MRDPDVKNSNKLSCCMAYMPSKEGVLYWEYK